jgi:UDP-N-acetylmuramate dehydrogenase
MSLPPTQIQWLRQRFGPALRVNEPMARHTWLRVGGPADALVTVARLEELRELLAWSAANRIPCLVLGGGSNLLVRDGGVRGVVLRLAGEFGSDTSVTTHAAGGELRAGAAVPLAQIVRMAVGAGLSGLESLAGIPGTLGGAIRMNAGTRQGCIADTLARLTLVDGTGSLQQRARAALPFAYRRLEMAAEREPVVIVSASFVLQGDEPEALAARVADHISRRRRSQPLDYPSAGCFFKNPPQGPGAGELIDRAGLKGRRIGDAEVSRRHANFIVNCGHATAAEILALAALVAQSVRDRHGIALEPEVHIVGSEAHA